MTNTISKITRAGQITLPKRIRMNKAFANAEAVAFFPRGDEVVIIPLVMRQRDLKKYRK